VEKVSGVGLGLLTTIRSRTLNEISLVLVSTTSLPHT